MDVMNAFRLHLRIYKPSIFNIIVNSIMYSRIGLLARKLLPDSDNELKMTYHDDNNDRGAILGHVNRWCEYIKHQSQYYPVPNKENVNDKTYD